MLLIALALLLGASISLIVQKRAAVWEHAFKSTRDLSLGMEALASARLAQSDASLRGIASDLREPPITAGTAQAAVRNAMRYDPFSAYLGVVDTAQHTVLALVAQGGPAEPAVAATLANAIVARAPGALGFQQMLRLPGSDDWFLPLTLQLPPAGQQRLTVFALVPARKLIEGAESLQLLPRGYVTFADENGVRLMRYAKELNHLDVNGPPFLATTLTRLRAQTHGSFEAYNPVVGYPVVFGHSRSRDLPLYVGAGLPASEVTAQWLRESIAPCALLVLGVAGVVVFAYRLREALQRQHASHQRQQYEARHDHLTGLLNRDAFARSVKAGLAGARGGQLALVQIDLSNFKDINDTLGHSAGDQLMRILARRFAALLRGSPAQVARTGGDEFGILLRVGRIDEELAALEQRLRAGLKRPITVQGVEVELTASMGAAIYPADAGEAGELFRCADIALYASKNSLQRFTRYARSMDNFSADSLAMKAELAKALRDGSLSVVYQPKLRLDDGSLAGVEVLSRWRHPVKGMVSPAVFIPLAENTELIHPFTRCVLQTAIAQASQWQVRGRAVPVAVNVSTNNLLDPGFTDTVAELLAANGLPPQLLELEITESAIMRHPEMTLKRLHALRELGVRLSIDDFGTGYTSLAYLKLLPVHTLKIDQLFVRNLDRDAGDQRIARSAIQLGHGFGMTVVAEGVESGDVAAMLRDYGCDYVQGYHYSRPLPADEFEAQWLA